LCANSIPPPYYSPFPSAQQLLGSLPGVDPNDPDIQNALKNAKKDGDDDKKKDGEGK
jgi:hypothetical protein